MYVNTPTLDTSVHSVGLDLPGLKTLVVDVSVHAATFSGTSLHFG